MYILNTMYTRLFSPSSSDIARNFIFNTTVCVVQKCILPETYLAIKILLAVKYLNMLFVVYSVILFIYISLLLERTKNIITTCNIL